MPKMPKRPRTKMPPKPPKVIERAIPVLFKSDYADPTSSAVIHGKPVSTTVKKTVRKPLSQLKKEAVKGLEDAIKEHNGV